MLYTLYLANSLIIYNNARERRKLVENLLAGMNGGGTKTRNKQLNLFIGALKSNRW